MDKIWLNHYPPNVVHEIEPIAYDSLPELLLSCCQKFHQRIALDSFHQCLSYAELEQCSRQLAAFLQQTLGLKKGQRVILMLPNSLQYPVAMLACLRIGLIVVNSNPLYTADELQQQICDAQAHTLIAWRPAAPTIAKIMTTTPLKHIILTELGDLFGFGKRIIFNTMLRFKYPATAIAKAISFRKALRLGATLSLTPTAIHQEDIAFLQYTGGTSGDYKAAMLSHHNILANLEQISAWLKPVFSEAQKNTILTALPLYHIFALTANCLSFMKIGARNILVTDPRNIHRLIKLLQRTPCHAITGVNTLFHALLQHPDFQSIDFSALKIALAGGMPLQATVAKQWQTITHVPLLEAYGLTEASPAVAINPTYVQQYNGSVGLPIPSTEVSIRDAREQELDCGQAGELWVRGPQVMHGYWRNEQATQSVLTQDAWLKTGDIAQLDAQGFITLLDRKKDMIIVSGFNVYPNEIERVLMMHPNIGEAAVIGIPHEASGEQIKAFIVKNDPDLTSQMILHYCREHLTAYKIPKIIQFAQKLPKSPVGKILRRALR